MKAPIPRSEFLRSIVQRRRDRLIVEILQDPASIVEKVQGYAAGRLAVHRGRDLAGRLSRGPYVSPAKPLPAASCRRDRRGVHAGI